MPALVMMAGGQGWFRSKEEQGSGKNLGKVDIGLGGSGKIIPTQFLSSSQRFQIIFAMGIHGYG